MGVSEIEAFPAHPVQPRSIEYRGTEAAYIPASEVVRKYDYDIRLSFSFLSSASCGGGYSCCCQWQQAVFFHCLPDMKLMVVYIKEGWPKRWNSFWVTLLGFLESRATECRRG